jgi:hypothetical protein
MDAGDIGVGRLRRRRRRSRPLAGRRARRAAGLPVDRAAPAAANTVSSAETIVVELGEAATAALLGAAPRAYDAQINDLLLARSRARSATGAAAPTCWSISKRTGARS